MSEALFKREGDLFLPSELVRGGWDDKSQHGSPPAGLLARAVDLVPTAVPMQVVRFTVDLFRPVPMSPLRVETVVRRDGKRIQVVDAFLFAGDLEVGRVSALKIRLAELDLEPLILEWEHPPPPEDLEPMRWSDRFGPREGLPRFHYAAIEVRTVDDSFLSYGPGTSWFRLKYPVVEGEDLSPFVRLATIADMSNGNSQSLDPQEWLYINPDITLYSHRLPVGEWVGMQSVARQHRSGIGMADTLVFDVAGPLGRISQAQVVDHRR
jgi:hypothetical protein